MPKIIDYEQHRKEFLIMLMKGRSKQNIADRYGRSRQWVYNVIEKLAITKKVDWL